MQASSITRSSVKTSGMRSVVKDLETREKGVDICVMMDGTSSMVSKIKAGTMKLIKRLNCTIMYLASRTYGCT